MKGYIKAGLVVLLLVAGFAIGYFFPRKSYLVVKPNWIRTENISFTVAARDVNCESFTISVLGFFAETIAEDIV